MPVDVPLKHASLSPLAKICAKIHLGLEWQVERHLRTISHSILALEMMLNIPARQGSSYRVIVTYRLTAMIRHIETSSCTCLESSFVGMRIQRHSEP